MAHKAKPSAGKREESDSAGAVRIRRALLSCHDKTGLEAFAKSLAGLGVELVASGGTAAFLTDHGVKVKTVEAFAGIPAQLDGRVKTLHPKVHGGILARRDDRDHMQAVGPDGLIDLVVVNLYPFQETVRKPGVTLATAVEQIDIGGVALLRAAAKNFAGAAAVSNPRQYAAVTEALRDGQGALPGPLARRLAVEAFELTSNYDQAIAAYVAEAGSEPLVASATRTGAWPETASITVKKRQRLRYGENPHQQGAWYVPATGGVWGLGTLSQLQGKELSYNNLLDIDAALRVLAELEGPSCAIIKHYSQCGLATAASLEEAYDRAFACDPESAFGGIVGFNERITAKLAGRLTSTFLEVILAPAVDADAVGLFAKKPNLRLVTLEWPNRPSAEPEWRQLAGSWLLQDANAATLDLLQLATKRAPTQQERTDLLFAWKAVKHVKSNGVLLVRDQAAVGIGQGQPSRVGSVRLAIEKAGERSQGTVAASDGFFPFPDSIELLAKAGVTAVIQPGGSIKDSEVVAAANAANIAMLMSGVRHFRH